MSLAKGERTVKLTQFAADDSPHNSDGCCFRMRWNALAMALTAGIGKLFGTVV